MLFPVDSGETFVNLLLKRYSVIIILNISYVCFRRSRLCRLSTFV